ncbi:MAG: NAD-dependent succinate-semialdehyde dehydrogenase [Simkaniaceae bacterium]|nr:NAD-dependent succinate-semialdehyde dehydrogenase [Simkaniaceae bacterium]
MNITEFKLYHNQLFINGNWVSTHKKIDVLNPYDYQVIGQAPHASREQVIAAVDVADQAFNRYRFSTPQERRSLLMRLSQLIREYRDELARMMTLEMGKPLADALGEIEYACSFLDWFAEEAARIYGDIIQSDQVNQKLLVSKQPVGVVGAITPWNFPLAMVTRKIAPALAVGCTVVLKASEETPFVAYALADLIQRAGYPDGVINIITGDPCEIGEILCSDARVRKISFTGSTRVGQLLFQQAAPQIKRLSLELGGNAPFIVFESANIDAAVEGALYLKLRNSSQSCICGNRFLIQDSIYDAFVDRFQAKYQRLKVGNGFEDVDMGPVINKTAKDRILNLIHSAQNEGADLMCGGDAFYNSCIAPTILSGVTQQMKIANEEIFGPVVTLMRFKDEQEALEIANATQYGLASYFYSQDFSQMMRVNDRLMFGMVGINETKISKAQAPFGGIKASGQGREGSLYGMSDYLNIKYTCLTFDSYSTVTDLARLRG